MAGAEEELDEDVLGGGVGGSGDGCANRAVLLDTCGHCVRKKKKEKKKQKRQYCLPLVDVAAAAGFAVARGGGFGGGS